MWDFLDLLKQTFLTNTNNAFRKRYVAVVVSLGIGGFLAWVMPHGRKPQPVTKANVVEAATDSVTEPLHREIASLHERIATLEQELVQAQAANQQRELIEGFKQEAAAKPPPPARHRKVARLHRVKNSARPTKPQKLAHTSARGAAHPTDIAGPLIPAGAVADTPGT